MEIIYQTDNWIHGIEDIKAIIVEQGYLSRLAFIKMKWQIGERIYTDEKLKNHKKEIAEEINYSVNEINRCIRWYKKSCELYKTKDWDQIENNIEKNQSWRRIVHQLLPPIEPIEETEEKRLERMKIEKRMQKIYAILKQDIEKNHITLTQDLLQFLKTKYKIDENKNYD